MLYKIKKNILVFFGAAMLLLSHEFSYATPAATITDYHATFIPGYDAQGNLQIPIRMYYAQDTAYFLLVDPATLITKIIPIADFKSRSGCQQRT